MLAFEKIGKIRTTTLDGNTGGGGTIEGASGTRFPSEWRGEEAWFSQGFFKPNP